MFEYRQFLHKATPDIDEFSRPGTKTIRKPTASSSAWAQASGFGTLMALERSLSASSVESESSSESTPSERSPEDLVAEQIAADKAAIRAEFQLHIDEGIIEDEEQLQDLDLLMYWQVRVDYSLNNFNVSNLNDATTALSGK